MGDVLIGIGLALILIAFITIFIKIQVGLIKKNSTTSLDGNSILDKMIAKKLEVMQDILESYTEIIRGLKEISKRDNSIIELQDGIIESLRKRRVSNRKIVCLCGSTRFKEAFDKANREESAKGNIVLTVAMFGHLEDLDMNSEEKVMFDDVHMSKIELADEILVLNVDGYIGSSTAREIEYARSLNKKVRFLED